MSRRYDFEHDMTKLILKGIREGIGESNSDAITPAQNDPTYREELKKFMEAVDPRVQVTKFKIYPKDRNVQFEGRLDSGINFIMSVRAMKLSISITDNNNQTQNIFVDDDLLSTLKKLQGYYENWVREWGTKLNVEYKPNQND